MSKRARQATGADAFEAHYQARFEARWPGLRTALLTPQRHAMRLNPRAAVRAAALPDHARPLPGLPQTFALDDAVSGFDAATAYFLDPASVRVATLLDVAPGHQVLDLCAAPGGKSLVLADALGLAMPGGDGTLHANEPSPARRGRLRRVLEGWLGVGEQADEVDAQAQVFGHDGSRWGLHHPGAYDRVLVDAPCSSERHVFADAAALAQWTAARPRQLTQRQVALLCAAVDSCRAGGLVVYATCALDEAENDDVVERVLRKRRGRVVVDRDVADTDPRLAGAEPTELGWRWLPDRCGEGPIYVARLRVGEPAEP
ncbi:MAG: hypothetical protein H6747_15760 [Deltaproteobacteria bacterium]|nr:hypothetical protein [Deltaproteobacteria bacterium]